MLSALGAAGTLALESEEAEAGARDLGLRFIRKGAQVERRGADVERGTRGVRRTLSRASLTAIEKDRIATSAQSHGVSVEDALNAARTWKRRHPKSEWEVPEVLGVDEAGKLRVQSVPYRFNIDPVTGKQAAPDSAHFQKISDALADEIIGISRKADGGDDAARRVMNNAGWYKNVESRLMNEYGSFAEMAGDLLGATSPNTPVGTNWRFTQDILKRATRGDFDDAMDGFAVALDRRHALLDGAEQYLEGQRAAGRTIKAAKTDPEYTQMVDEAKAISQRLQDNVRTIKQENGKNYGINSYNAMVALADRWRIIRKGAAPKAKNFSGNLTGFSDQATIDVWAARNLRRHAGLPPIPSAAERGVSGTVIDPVAFKSSQEFGFGQDVIADATRKINAELGTNLEPRDVQALQWFAEKDHWTNRGWTSAQGEGGSFETMMDLDPVESLVVGTSRQQNQASQGKVFIPGDEDQAAAAQRFGEAAEQDFDIRAHKTQDTKGLFGGDVERALDVDIVSTEDQIPVGVLDEIARQAAEDNQEAIFVARRVRPEVGQTSPESFQVGSEAYFRTPVDIEDSRIGELQGFLEERGVPGFTVIVDPREAGNRAIGIRFVDIPQFYAADDFARMSPQEYAGHVQQTFANYDQIGRDLTSQFPEIKIAQPAFFDVNVKSRGEIQDYLAQRANPTRDPDALSQEFWGFKPATSRFQFFAGEAAPYYSGLRNRAAESQGLGLAAGSAKPKVIAGLGGVTGIGVAGNREAQANPPFIAGAGELLGKEAVNLIPSLAGAATRDIAQSLTFPFGPTFPRVPPQYAEQAGETVKGLLGGIRADLSPEAQEAGAEIGEAVGGALESAAPYAKSFAEDTMAGRGIMGILRMLADPELAEKVPPEIQSRLNLLP